MVEIVFNYVPSDKDFIVNVLNTDVLIGNEFTKDRVFVIFAAEHNLTKKDIEFIKDVAKTNIKIVISDYRLVKGLHSSNNFKINRNENETTLNPFEIAKMFLTMEDRDYVLDFCLTNRPSLYMPIKVMISQFPILSSFNNRIIALLDTYQWKVNREILYYIIAFVLKPEPIRFLKWLYPKKNDGK